MKNLILLLASLLIVTHSYATSDITFDGELIKKDVSHSSALFNVGNYIIYKPKAFSGASVKKLVVMLHGCLQTPEEFLASSKMDKWADEMGFAILLPVQANSANSYQCWNWWHPYNQQKYDYWYENEPGMIVRMVDVVTKKFSISEDHIYMTGMSAGGAMANIIASCFPSKFQAISMHSGVQFTAAGWTWWDVESLKSLGKYGSDVSPESSAFAAFTCASTPLPIFAIGERVPAVIFQGTKSYMSYKHAEQIEAQYLAFNDYLDDGFLNKSPQYKTKHEFFGEGQRAAYPYDVYRTYSYGQLVLERYKIHGLGHAWSGGDSKFEFNDSNGPDATRFTIEFFKKFDL